MANSHRVKSWDSGNQIESFNQVDDSARQGGALELCILYFSHDGIPYMACVSTWEIASTSAGSKWSEMESQLLCSDPSPNTVAEGKDCD